MKVQLKIELDLKDIDLDNSKESMLWVFRNVLVDTDLALINENDSVVKIGNVEIKQIFYEESK